MLREEGVVIALEEKYALVRGTRKKACGSCQGESSCGTLSGGLGHRETRFLALNPLGAQVGQRVMLELREGAFLRASFTLYIVPLIGLMVSGIITRAVLLALDFGQAAEGWAALAGFLGMGLTFWLQKQRQMSSSEQDAQRPVIADILSPPPEVRYSVD